MVNEDSDKASILLEIPCENIANLSQSLKWRIFHGTHSMLGGLFLTIGSSMYFREVTRCYPMALAVGGWFLTIGSFFLLLADLQEWWYNRIGCCFDQKYQNIYEVSNNKISQHSHFSISTRWKRIEIRTNFFVAACGSALYVAGSFLLIPTFEKYVDVGNWLVVIGSATIFLSASWKIYQTSRINVADPHDHRCRLTNIMNDISALSINVFNGFGSVFYFFGVIFSQLSYSTDDFSINISAGLCVVGGAFFFLASIFLQFRYYCIDR